MASFPFLGGISSSWLSDSITAGLTLLSSKAKPHAGTHGPPRAHPLPPHSVLTLKPQLPQLPSSQLILPLKKILGGFQGIYTSPRIFSLETAQGKCSHSLAKQTGPWKLLPQGTRSSALPLTPAGSPWCHSPRAAEQPLAGAILLQSCL